MLLDVSSFIRLSHNSVSVIGHLYEQPQGCCYHSVPEFSMPLLSFNVKVLCYSFVTIHFYTYFSCNIIDSSLYILMVFRSIYMHTSTHRHMYIKYLLYYLLLILNYSKVIGIKQNLDIFSYNISSTCCFNGHIQCPPSQTKVVLPHPWSYSVQNH